MFACKPYAGKEPYIFVSYSHADAKVVLPIISFLQENGYRVWYDDGIEPGTEWPDFIASRILDCTVFIAMLSPNYDESTNCRNEVNFAQRHKKQILCIYTINTELSHGLQMQLGSYQAIHMEKYKTPHDFFDRLLSIALLKTTRISPETIPDVPYSTDGLSDNPFYLYNDYCNYVGACFSLLCSPEGAALVQKWCKSGLQEIAETQHIWELNTPQDCGRYLNSDADDKDLGLRFTPLTFEEWIIRCHEYCALEEHWSFSWNSCSFSSADDDYMDYDEDQSSLLWHIDHILDAKPFKSQPTKASYSANSDRQNDLLQSIIALKQAYDARKDQCLYLNDLESAIQAIKEGKLGVLKTAQLNPKHKQAAMDNVDGFARYFAKQKRSHQS